MPSERGKIGKRRGTGCPGRWKKLKHRDVPASTPAWWMYVPLAIDREEGWGGWKVGWVAHVAMSEGRASHACVPASALTAPQGGSMLREGTDPSRRIHPSVHRGGYTPGIRRSLPVPATSPPSIHSTSPRPPASPPSLYVTLQPPPPSPPPVPAPISAYGSVDEGTAASRPGLTIIRLSQITWTTVYAANLVFAALRFDAGQPGPRRPVKGSWIGSGGWHIAGRLGRRLPRKFVGRLLFIGN